MPRQNTHRVLLAAMTLANAMILVDQTAVPLTLPEIMRSFEVGSAMAQWVLTASLLPLAGLLVFGGTLGDLIGRRRVLLTGTVLFTCASVAGGFAPVFPMLIAARVAQGVGGALMLPATVAIVSSSFSASARGRALGTMGGIAAIAGALGPTIGGSLTSAISWRAVLLVNLPLGVLCLVATIRSVPADPERKGHERIDVAGTVLLCVALVGLVFGLSQTQGESWSSPEVWLPVVASALAAIAFVGRERRTANPLMSFRLLTGHRNYLGAVVSQGVGGMAEMGLGIIFPLMLILNMEMTPVVAGLALIPATIPMIVVAPLAGRWYDRAGGRPPLAAGFAILALSGIAMAVGADARRYTVLLPGLVLYGIGLALVLTTNDPVSLDSVAEKDHGQASGVSATAEQAGGAIGIAAIGALFHNAYVDRLISTIDSSPLPDLTARSSDALRSTLQAAEQTGLRPEHVAHKVERYLRAADDASSHGYAIAFVTVTVIALVGLLAVTILVRRPADQPTGD